MWAKENFDGFPKLPGPGSVKGRIVFHIRLAATAPRAGVDWRMGKKIVYSSRFVRVILAQGPC